MCIKIVKEECFTFVKLIAWCQAILISQNAVFQEI